MVFGARGERFLSSVPKLSEDAIVIPAFSYKLKINGRSDNQVNQSIMTCTRAFSRAFEQL